jgi:hypothetical protein
VSYRDDVDTLYSRALVLQRELDTAQQKLAQRDAELAQLQGHPRSRAETSPGIRELRGMPDPHEALERLVDTSRSTRGRESANLPPIPMPDWAHIVNTNVTSTPLPDPHSMVELVRDGVSRLAAEDLFLVAKIVTELTDGMGNDEMLRQRLRWLASELALTR